MSNDDRTYDLIVFGATSFVGQLVCRRMVERVGTDGELRWAIAGRNAHKLAGVAASTGATVDQIVAEAGDADAMAELAASTNVVASTVGPYALYGSDLVAACAAAGTDYCDLTGEPQWIARMIDAHQPAAEASGARIVNSCGFDSIPSDIGVLFTQTVTHDERGRYCNRIAMRVKATRGGASGGTLASGINAVAESAADKELRAAMADPYCLTPASAGPGVRQPRVTTPARDDVSGQWVAPFVMASINTPIVHRSHALLGRVWGDDFRYDEAMLMGEGPLGVVKASAVVGGVAGFAALAAFSPTRAVLERVLPKPGEGPSPEAQEAGFFDLRFYGSTSQGDEVRTKVTGDRDPGYGSTSKMMTEAALLLVETRGSGNAGGFLTPASAFGIGFADRLADHAGLTFERIG